MEDCHTFCGPVFVSGQHQVMAAGKGFADRLKGTTPHDHGVTQCQTTKMLQILGQVPRQLILLPDDSLRIHRHNHLQSSSEYFSHSRIQNLSDGDGRQYGRVAMIIQEGNIFELKLKEITDLWIQLQRWQGKWRPL